LRTDSVDAATATNVQVKWAVGITEDLERRRGCRRLLAGGIAAVPRQRAWSSRSAGESPTRCRPTPTSAGFPARRAEPDPGRLRRRVATDQRLGADRRAVPPVRRAPLVGRAAVGSPARR
jgi:hypothetical protein